MPNLKFLVTYDVTATVTEVIEARTYNEAKALAQSFCTEVIKEARRTGAASRITLTSVVPHPSNPTDDYKEVVSAATASEPPSASPNDAEGSPSTLPPETTSSRFAESKKVYDA